MKLKVDAAGLSIKPGLDVIRNAREFLAKHFACTRLVAAAYLSERMGKRVYLKLEMELPTGSFKVRGALWALAVRLKKTGTQEASASNTGNSGEAIEEVIASSTGNHGAAVAYAAKLLGVKARIFLPAGCNPVKRGRIAALGAEIVENGSSRFGGGVRIGYGVCETAGRLFFE